ncbi:MAG TPA: FkbM family methyltransferase [Rhodocyclaceae bacterium]
MSSYRYQIARSFLRQKNAEHIERYPQLACFAYDAITLAIHMDGRYERDELEFLAERIFPALPQPAACLDIGANIGNHSLHFARHFDRVIAFEPHPRTFGLLAINAAMAANVVALNCGASRQAGTVSVNESRTNMGASAIGRSGGDGGNTVSFALQRIDEVPEVTACERIAFVKIDVEGHEREALEGAAETLRRHRPVIALEALGDEVEDGTTTALALLREIGYAHIYELADQGLIGRLPRRLAKAARALVALLTGRRVRRPRRLQRVERLEKRNYPMLLCAMEPING